MPANHVSVPMGVLRGAWHHLGGSLSTIHFRTDWPSVAVWGGSEGQASCGGENQKSLWESPMPASHLAVPMGAHDFFEASQWVVPHGRDLELNKSPGTCMFAFRSWENPVEKVKQCTYTVH